MRFPLLLAALAGVAAPLPAQPQSIPPGTYRIDPARTRVSFSVSQLGISRYTGRFEAPSGALAIDPARPDTARIDVTFPMERLTTGKPGPDRMLHGRSFFDVAHFPTAHFAALVPIGRAVGDITGDLTLHGVTRTVTLHAGSVGARVNPATNRLEVLLSASGTIRRSAFGVGFGAPIVSDKAALVIDAAFEAV